MRDSLGQPAEHPALADYICGEAGVPGRGAERFPLKGDRLRGELVGAAAADWLLTGPEGTGSLDVRVTLRTDDGGIIFVQYYGRSDVSRDLELPATIYVAPRFETGDERYVWLNRIQALGKGSVQEDLLLGYEWYEVR